MKKKLFIFFVSSTLLLMVLALSNCTKDRIPPIVTPTEPIEDDTIIGGIKIEPGILFINEFVAKGSLNANEYGTYEDWIEIYNPNNFDVVLDSNSWYISDAGPSNPEKFLLPYTNIPAKGFLVIWCDGLGVIDTQIHTTFNLSASGEHILLYYKKLSSDEGIIIDDYQYEEHLNGGNSEGRYTDGVNNWQFFSIPTIGASNN